MSDSDLMEIGMGMTFGGLALLVLSLYFWKRLNLIKNTPTSKVRSLAMGFVEVYGEVIPAKGTILKSPLTNQDCVYYKYTIEEYRKSGKNSKWVTIKSGNKSVPFYLKDNTGIVLVNPQGASVNVKRDYSLKPRGNLPASINKFLIDNNIKYKGFLGLKRNLRFREYKIEPGNKVFIMGTAADNPFMEEGTAMKGVEDVMIKKGKIQRFFYISDSSEKQIITRLKLSYLGVIASPLLILSGMAVMFLYLGIM